MINIQADPQYASQIDQARIEKIANLVLEHEHVSSKPDVSIVVSTDETLHRLNKEYLGEDTPTDVLSFPSDEVDPGTGNRYLGDIIISYPRVIAQAKQGGHSPSAELELLVIHGTLHLLGYDHAKPEDKEVMWAAQSDLLAASGNPIKSPPE